MTVIKDEYISEDITLHDLLPLGFLKKSRYTGEKGNMRFLLEKKESEEGEARLRACVWPEPFAYDHTDEKLKKEVLFDFSDEGMGEALKWLNERLSEYR